MRKLESILTEPSPSLETLPILHSCEAYDLENILESGKLETSLCKVFEEKYLYTFYGIPSYRKNVARGTTLPSYYPVCFVLNFALCGDLEKIYPLDSGAFMCLDAVKSDHFHHRVQISDLELAPELSKAKGLVSTFYKSNGNYIKHLPKVSVDEINPANAAAHGYVSMINSKSMTDYDNRVATVEMIYKKDIPLSSANLKQIILPAVFLDDEKIRQLVCERYGINQPMNYQTIKGNSQEYFGSIYNEYISFVEEEFGL